MQPTHIPVAICCPRPITGACRNHGEHTDGCQQRCKWQVGSGFTSSTVENPWRLQARELGISGQGTGARGAGGGGGGVFLYILDVVVDIDATGGLQQHAAGGAAVGWNVTQIPQGD